MCKIEHENVPDRYAVLIQTMGNEDVGHVPIKVSKCIKRFLKKKNGEVEVEVTGCRYNLGQGKGLELPADFKFYHGSREVLKLLKKDLLENGVDLKIMTDIVQSEQEVYLMPKI